MTEEESKLWAVHDGRLLDHHVTVVTYKGEIVHIMRDEPYQEELDRVLGTVRHGEVTKLIKESFKKEFAALPDLSNLPGIYDAFSWYYDKLMDSISKIGNSPSRLIEFEAYETVGASIGCTKSLARADFS